MTPLHIAHSHIEIEHTARYNCTCTNISIPDGMSLLRTMSHMGHKEAAICHTSYSTAPDSRPSEKDRDNECIFIRWLTDFTQHEFKNTCVSDICQTVILYYHPLRYSLRPKIAVRLIK